MWDRRASGTAAILAGSAVGCIRRLVAKKTEQRDNGTMRTTAVFPVLLLFCGCDLEARHAEQLRLDRCKLSLPVLRSEPSRPYRVIQVLEDYSETDLVWYACLEQADALISTFVQEDVTKTTLGGGLYLRSRTASEAKLIGRAIKYESNVWQQPSGPPSVPAQQPYVPPAAAQPPYGPPPAPVEPPSAPVQPVSSSKEDRAPSLSTEFDVECRFGISGCESQASDACGHAGFHIISSRRTQGALGTAHFYMKAACGPASATNVPNVPARKPWKDPFAPEGP